jgi:hypothetical protein
MEPLSKMSVPMRFSGFATVALAGIIFGGCSSTQSAAPPSTYLLGEKVQLGTLSYTVFETQWLTHFGDGPTPRIPENRFFLIRMAAVNGGSQDASIPNLTIEDDKGKTYEELSNGDGVPQWAGYLRSVHPADNVQGNILFDAPPAHYKLKLSDESHTRFAYVDIPLSFGSETPEIPTPGEKK